MIQTRTSLCTKNRAVGWILNFVAGVSAIVVGAIGVVSIVVVFCFFVGNFTTSRKSTIHVFSTCRSSIEFIYERSRAHWTAVLPDPVWGLRSGFIRSLHTELPTYHLLNGLRLLHPLAPGKFVHYCQLSVCPLGNGFACCHFSSKFVGLSYFRPPKSCRFSFFVWVLWRLFSFSVLFLEFICYFVFLFYFLKFILTIIIAVKELNKIRLIGGN